MASSGPKKDQKTPKSARNPGGQRAPKEPSLLALLERAPLSRELVLAFQRKLRIDNLVDGHTETSVTVKTAVFRGSDLLEEERKTEVFLQNLTSLNKEALASIEKANMGFSAAYAEFRKLNPVSRGQAKKILGISSQAELDSAISGKKLTFFRSSAKPEDQ